MLGAEARRSDELTPMKHLTARFDTVHFGFFDATLAPVLEIDSGESVFVNTVSADPTHEVPSDWIPLQVGDIYARAERGTGPLTATTSSVL
jgi:acetamidase/formamidase